MKTRENSPKDAQTLEVLNSTIDLIKHKFVETLPPLLELLLKDEYLQKALNKVRVKNLQTKIDFGLNFSAEELITLGVN